MNFDLRKVDWKFIGQIGSLTILFTYLFLFNSTNYDFMDAGKMFTGVILLCAVGLVWIVRGNRSSNPLRIPLIIYAAVFLLTGITSVDPRRSLGEGLYLLVGIFLLCISMEMAASGIEWRRIFLAMAIAGGIVMFFLWVPVFFWYRDWLASAPGQFIPSIIYRLPTATVNSFFLNVLFFLGLAGILGFKSLAGKIISAIYLAPVIGLSYFASSRAAWLADGLGFLVLAFFFYRKNQASILKIWRFLRLRWVLLVLLAIVVVVEGVGGGFLLYRQTIHPTHGDVASSRAGLWGPAIPTFLQHPILGQGPFTFQISFVRMDSVPPWEFFPHAHNVILNILAEMGLLGLFAFLIVYMASWVTLFRRLKIKKPDNQPVVWTAMAILVVFSVQGFFDCYHIDPMGLWAMLIMCGAAVGEPVINKLKTPFSRPWWILLLVGGGLLNYLVFKPYSDGVNAANQNEWNTASQQLNEAVRLDPNNAIAQQQNGLAESILAEKNNPAALEFAIHSFEQAVRLDPDWAQNHLDLGALYLKRNNSAADVASAISEFKKGVALAPDATIFWLNLGAALETSGDTQNAVQAYEKVLTLNPDLIAAFFWRSSSVRKQASTDWRIQNPAKPEPTISELKQSIAKEPSYAPHRINLAKALFQEGRLSDARQQLMQAQLSVFPFGMTSLEVDWWDAELLAATGNVEKAAQSGQKVFDQYLFQGLYGPGTSGSLSKYAQEGFRRPVMAIEFVPWVNTIPLTDTWGQRLAKLVGWYDQLGDKANAQKMREVLNKVIPDFDNFN